MSRAYFISCTQDLHIAVGHFRIWRTIQYISVTAYSFHFNSADCPELKVANAVSRPACSVVNGSTVTVICDTGYTMIGNDELTCSAGVYSDHPSCFETGLAGIYRLTHKYSRLSLSRLRLSRITAYLEEKI